MRGLYKFMFLLVLAFCHMPMANAIEQGIPEQFDNYKINQVMTTEEGVFLLVDDLWIGAEGILAMPGNVLLLENGKWVSISEVIAGDTYYTWRCRVCGYVNPQGTTKCLNYRNHPK